MNAMKRCALAAVLVVWTVLGLIGASHASEQRTALVIGNAKYGYGPLANPVNDALAITRALDKAGFEGLRLAPLIEAPFIPKLIACALESANRKELAA